MLGSRVVPLQRIGLAMTATLGLATVLLDAPLALLVPAFVVAGALTMAWNGVAFAAVAELAGTCTQRRRPRHAADRSLRSAGVAAPIAFAAVVSAGLLAPRLRARSPLPARRLVGAAPVARPQERRLAVR